SESGSCDGRRRDVYLVVRPLPYGRGSVKPKRAATVTAWSRTTNVVRAGLSLLVLLPALTQAAGPSAADTARAIRAAGFDPQECYLVRDLSIVKEDVRVFFNEGYLIFSKPVAGERVAALFTTNGEGGDAEV